MTLVIHEQHSYTAKIGLLAKILSSDVVFVAIEIGYCGVTGWCIALLVILCVYYF